MNVTVIFDEAIPAEAQGVALLALERHLRDITRLDIRVFKNRMGDDSKLRVRMTAEEREKL